MIQTASRTIARPGLIGLPDYDRSRIEAQLSYPRNGAFVSIPSSLIEPFRAAPDAPLATFRDEGILELWLPLAVEAIDEAVEKALLEPLRSLGLAEPLAAVLRHVQPMVTDWFGSRVRCEIRIGWSRIDQDWHVDGVNRGLLQLKGPGTILRTPASGIPIFAGRDFRGSTLAEKCGYDEHRAIHMFKKTPETVEVARKAAAAYLEMLKYLLTTAVPNGEIRQLDPGMLLFMDSKGTFHRAPSLVESLLPIRAEDFANPMQIARATELLAQLYMNGLRDVPGRVLLVFNG